MVVDGSALIAIYRGEPEAAAFIDLIDRADQALLSAVTAVEVAIVLTGERVGATREQAESLLESLGLVVEPVDTAQHRAAVEAHFAFGRGRHPAGLDLADCFAYALAKARGLPLLFQGETFARTDVVPAWQP